MLWTSLGRLPGVALGAAIVAWLEPAALEALIGAFLLVAVGLSVATLRIPMSRVTQASAGFVGGVMGTASSIGGPPLALLYQHEAGPTLRSTLAASFTIGTAMSLTALALAGAVTRAHWAFGVAMMPAVALGLWASRMFHAKLDAGWLRPSVLAFSGMAALGVMVRALRAL